MDYTLCADKCSRKSCPVNPRHPDITFIPPWQSWAHFKGTGICPLKSRTDVRFFPSMKQVPPALAQAVEELLEELEGGNGINEDW